MSDVVIPYPILEYVAYMTDILNSDIPKEQKAEFNSLVGVSLPWEEESPYDFYIEWDSEFKRYTLVIKEKPNE